MPECQKQNSQRFGSIVRLEGDPGLVAMDWCIDGWMWCVRPSSLDCWSVRRLVCRDHASDVGSFDT